MAAIDPAGIDVFEDPGAGPACEKYTSAVDLYRLAGPSTFCFFFFFLPLAFKPCASSGLVCLYVLMARGVLALPFSITLVGV